MAHLSGSKNRLLMLIDDSRFDLKINERIAKFAGVFDEIITCSSGKDALNYLLENIDNAEKWPCLILLDIQMPEMDGFEFMTHYATLPASQRGKCKVAILSSTEDSGDIEKINANPNILMLIKKPLQPALLQQLMADISS